MEATVADEIQQQLRIDQAKKAYRETLARKNGQVLKELVRVHLQDIRDIFDDAGIPPFQFSSEKTVLDLGCGADRSDDKRPPMLPRYLATLGVETVGIDMATNDPTIPDIYHHIPTYLDTHSSLRDILKTNDCPTSYDFIYSAMTFDPYNPSPALHADRVIRTQSAENMLQNIIFQEGPLLKPYGFLCFNNHEPQLWQKNDQNELIRLV